MLNTGKLVFLPVTFLTVMVGLGLSRLSKGLIQKSILAVQSYNVVFHISILVCLLLVEAASGSSDGKRVAFSTANLISVLRTLITSGRS